MVPHYRWWSLQGGATGGINDVLLLEGEVCDLRGCYSVSYIIDVSIHLTIKIQGALYTL